ncbi:MAG TPA: glycosyltransferase family 39 protein [Dehalococcoidia bacterium]|nr:glycosyltransferase family 39 protein [Dehalococcoidia bacterium]
MRSPADAPPAERPAAPLCQAGAVPAGWFRLGALTVLTLASAARFANLGGQSLWYDEAVTILLARLPPVEIVRRTMEDTLPPLSYLLLHPWLGVGDGELIWRYPSAALGVLLVALVARLGRAIGSDPAGLAAGAVIAVSPFFVYYSQEVRLYALLAVLAAGYFWTLLPAPRRQSIWSAGLIGAAALYTHPLAALFLPVPAVAAAIARRRVPRRELLGVLIAGVGFLPWAVSLTAQSSRVLTTFWTDPVNPLQLLLSLVVFAFGPPTGSLVLAGGLSLILVTIAFGLRAPAGPLPRPGLILCVLVTALPPVALLALSLVRPLYLDRVLIASGIGLALLAGLLWARLPDRLKSGVAALWLALAGFGLLRWYADPEAAKPPLRAAVDLIAEAGRPGDVIVHTSDGSFYPFRVYAPRFDNRLLAGDPEYVNGSPRGRWTEQVLELSVWEAERIVPDSGHAWVVVALDHSVEWQRDQARRLDQFWRRLDEYTIGGVVIREYELPPP